ncbi:hypothetical protein STAS_02003, partial [Striga asiatica]
MARAATSWARAAISAVGYVPSHILDFFLGSRISQTHLPQLRFRTPRYVVCSQSAAALGGGGGGGGRGAAGGGGGEKGPGYFVPIQKPRISHENFSGPPGR